MKYRGLLLPIILAAMCGDDAFMLNTKGGKGMQSAYRREKIVRTEKEFDINGTKVMAYSRKDAIKSKRDSWIQTYGTPGFTIVGITRTFQLGNALPRSQDRANIMFNYHLTHKWDQYYH